MGISIMNLLPTSQSHASTANGAGGQPASGFDKLLTDVAGIVGHRSSQGQPKGEQDVPSAAVVLQQLLRALSNGKLDVTAESMGLSKSQLVKLQALLEQLLKDSKDGTDSGSDLLAGLLALSQLLGSIQPAQVASLAKLLGTGADGTISTQAILDNVRLLEQAVQLMANSDGHLTLLQAVQQLSPQGDAFASQLEEALEQQQASTPKLQDTGPPGDTPDSGLHPPPQAADVQATPETAGSNGLDLTPAIAGNPSDGAAEGTKGAESELIELVRALQALIHDGQPHNGRTPPGFAHPDELASHVAPSATNPALTEASMRDAAVSGPIAANAALKAGGPEAPKSPAPAVAGDDRPDHAPKGSKAVAQTTAAAALPGASNADDGQPAAGGSDGQASPPSRTVHLDAPQQPAFGAVLNAGANNGTPPAPAAAPQVASGPLPLDQSVVQQLVQQATLALRDGQQEFRIQLKPEFLGAMEVRVSVDSTGAAVVRLSAENPATRQLIDANLAQLRQAFGTTHVRVEYVPTFSNWDTSTAFGQGGGFWQGQNPFQGSNNMPAALPFSGEAPESSPEPRPVPAAAGAISGGIDLEA